ncbi:hypothetical protein [Priestia megaterium]|uniref:hypothetical protein n=1 Tax=Priestia megaterium TaxID=1404 RepID=UPI001CDD8D98|nr:hypothetical protein [Priestia megaterium]MCA4158042.1 hypothetical protein [Priestia megaterium]
MENVLNVLNHIMLQMKSLALKDIAVLVQICFYIIGATIAILTYRSAKKGLLNTVNTEYQKRVMDHLESLSEKLYSEFKPESKESHAFEFNLGEELEDTLRAHNKQCRSLKSKKTKEDFVIYAIEETKLETSLYKLTMELISSPFLPDHIAEYVAKYLLLRYEKLGTIIDDCYEELIVPELLKCEPINDILHYKSKFMDTVSSRLSITEYSPAKVELEVHEIRSMIKQYLKSFNPLP